ncbi:MAG: tetratricopeptide repeat protein [Hyphomicrobiales bacterium]
MADIFHEVDEEVRRERLQQLWDRYSIYVIALAVLIVAAIGAWRGYEYWEAKKAATAGAAFESALSLSEAGKHAEAEAAFAKVAAEAPAGYRTLARLRAAAELAQTKRADAVKAYDELAADTSLGATLQDLAAVRAGMLMVDSAPLSDMRRRLDPVSEPGRTFRHSARELLALSAWRNHDFTAARRYIDMIATDAETPPGTRARADVLSALIAADGSKG